MAIGGHPVRYAAHGCQRRGEKCLSGSHVSGLAQTYIDQTTITIDRRIKVVPAAFHLDVCLIDIPADPSFAATSGSKPLS